MLSRYPARGSVNGDRSIRSRALQDVRVLLRPAGSYAWPASKDIGEAAGEQGLETRVPSILDAIVGAEERSGSVFVPRREERIRNEGKTTRRK